MIVVIFAKICKQALIQKDVMLSFLKLCLIGNLAIVSKAVKRYVHRSMTSRLTYFCSGGPFIQQNNPKMQLTGYWSLLGIDNMN